MAIVILASFVALALMTLGVLADSGYRLWQAIGRHKAILLASARDGRQVSLPAAPRVTTRISYARPAMMERPATRRAAA